MVDEFIAEMFEEVKTGNSVAVFEDYPVLAYGIQQGNGFKTVTPKEKGSSYGFAVLKGSNPELLAAFNAGELAQDAVVVVRFQGPRANGMPELHKLTPPLAVLQGKGHRVALVTDGRMSGASGKVPAAIHISPEALAGGPLALKASRALADGGQGETLRQIHGHVFNRMHGQIGAPFLQGLLQFFDKQAFAADRCQRAVEHFVAAGLNSIGVPYKGDTLILADLLGRSLDLGIISVPQSIELLHDSRLRAYAEAGADLISVGALTHSVIAADLSMEIELS